MTTNRRIAVALGWKIVTIPARVAHQDGMKFPFAMDVLKRPDGTMFDRYSPEAFTDAEIWEHAPDFEHDLNRAWEIEGWLRENEPEFHGIIIRRFKDSKSVLCIFYFEREQLNVAAWKEGTAETLALAICGAFINYLEWKKQQKEQAR